MAAGLLAIWVQAGFLLAWLDPFLLRLHGICSPVFHCHSCPWATFACPIGILAQYGALHVFPFLAVGTLLIVGFAVRQSGMRLGLPVRIPPGPCCADSHAQAAAAGLAGPDALRGSRRPGVSRSLLLRRGEPVVHLPGLSGGRLGGRRSLQRPAIDRPARDHLADREQIGHLGGVFALHALHPAPLVYALLPAGRDLRSVQLRVGGVLAVSTEPLQRLRSVPRPVQIPRTVGTAGERPPLHSLFRVRGLPGSFHRHGFPAEEKYVSAERTADHSAIGPTTQHPTSTRPSIKVPQSITAPSGGLPCFWVAMLL